MKKSSKAAANYALLGYTIVLDDFEWHPPNSRNWYRSRTLLRSTYSRTSRGEQERLVRTYQPRGILMLAEKVETREEFEWALKLGYNFFQGYFFARPAVLSGTEIQPRDHDLSAAATRVTKSGARL